MGFSTKECEWSKTTIKVLGRTLVGIRGFEFEKNIETEYLYGAGDDPIDIQRGNKGYPGSLNMLKYEVDMMNDAARAAGYEDITEVPHDAVVITCQYKKKLADPARTITSAGVAFTSLKYALQQNAKMSEVPMPFLSMKTTVL